MYDISFYEQKKQSPQQAIGLKVYVLDYILFLMTFNKIQDKAFQVSTL